MIASPLLAFLAVHFALSAGVSIATFVGLKEYERGRRCYLGSRKLYISALLGLLVLLLVPLAAIGSLVFPTISQAIALIFYPIYVSLFSLAALSKWLLGPVVARKKDVKWLARIVVVAGVFVFLTYFFIFTLRPTPEQMFELSFS